MAITLAHMKEITPPTPKVGEMNKAIEERPLSAGENPEVEDGPQLPKEFHWWENEGSHLSITGGPRIRIHINHTLTKWNHIITRGGPLHLGQIAPPMGRIIHPHAVQHRVPLVKGGHLFMAIPQVTGHLPQDIFAPTQLIGGQALHHPTRGLSGAPKDSQVFPIRSTRVATLVGITVPGKGSMTTMAWSAGMKLECFLICTMESTVPLDHRGTPERCMGEAQVQRGTGVKPQSKLGKIIKEEAWSWSRPPSHTGCNNYLYPAPNL